MHPIFHNEISVCDEHATFASIDICPWPAEPFHFKLKKTAAVLALNEKVVKLLRRLVVSYAVSRDFHHRESKVGGPL
ncbi:hypothetical protein FAZ95_36425 [Trinickia violacea]|uniref:Uncharacterized protein n=1 Tax=Trinickia violacea TaxID=2571746 RepID=A0A4P8J3G7_9BURK|nr:hypothetical protein [Trinickia violacea]QCP54414.1 hypothetical protein FAZ95_36425 [Trinickia violacea]